MMQLRDITLIAVVGGEIGVVLQRARSRPSGNRDRNCRLVIYELMPPTE